MDAEKFDKVVLDLLYDELDDVTRAAALRYADQSARAKALLSDLRATRKVGALPLVEPPPDLQERILAAEARARAGRSPLQRLGSLVSLAAGYAMRPQLAMAALLLLMLGSSLIFLRARPGEPGAVQVTERGVPEAERDTVAVVPMPRPPAPAERAQGERAHGPARPRQGGDLDTGRASARSEPAPATPAAAAPAPEKKSGGGAEPDDATRDRPESEAYAQGMTAYREGRYAEAESRFDEAAGEGGATAGHAALLAARAALRRAGCPTAIDRVDRVVESQSGTVSEEARWLSAECHRELGNAERARTAYRALAGTARYGERARAALAALEPPLAAPPAAAAKPGREPAAPAR